MVSFRKKIKILPGVSLNISKSGVSTTIGAKGASVNVGSKGSYLNTGIPGTGVYNRRKIGGGDLSDGNMDKTGAPLCDVDATDPMLEQQASDIIERMRDLFGQDAVYIAFKTFAPDTYKAVRYSLLRADVKCPAMIDTTVKYILINDDLPIPQKLINQIKELNDSREGFAVFKYDQVADWCLHQNIRPEPVSMADVENNTTYSQSGNKPPKGGCRNVALMMLIIVGVIMFAVLCLSLCSTDDTKEQSTDTVTETVDAPVVMSAVEAAKSAKDSTELLIALNKDVKVGANTLSRIKSSITEFNTKKCKLSISPPANRSNSSALGHGKSICEEAAEWLVAHDYNLNEIKISCDVLTEQGSKRGVAVYNASTSHAEIVE